MVDNTSIDCNLTDSFRNFESTFCFVVYSIFLPIYFFVGLSGNITLLLAFAKQTKTDKAYAYQVFLTVSKTIEIFWSSLHWWGFKWNSGFNGSPGHDWFMNNYAAMFWLAHLGCPLSNGFILTSLLFSVAMTADRIFAISKPFIYRSIDHRSHQIVAVVICVAIGLGTSIFEFNRFTVSPGINTTYILEFNNDYLVTEMATVLGHLRTGVRLISLITLIMLNVIMVVIFHMHNKKSSLITVSNDKKVVERKAAEKNLLILTIYNSCLMPFVHIPHCVYFIGAFTSVNFDACYGPFLSSLADGCICVADSVDLFIIVGINKVMRRTVLSILPCCKNRVSTSTGTESLSKR